MGNDGGSPNTNSVLLGHTFGTSPKSPVFQRELQVRSISAAMSGRPRTGAECCAGRQTALNAIA